MNTSDLENRQKSARKEKNQTVVVLSSSFCDPYLIASQMVSIVVEQLRNFLDVHSVIEGCGITYLSFVS